MQIVTARWPSLESRLLYPTTYFHLLTRALRLEGGQRAQLLAGTPLKLDELVEFDRGLSERDHHTIIGNALRLADRATFALEMGSSMSLAAHGLMGQLLSSASTLEEAWSAMLRFQALRVPLLKLVPERNSEHLIIRLSLQRPIDAVGQFLLEAVVINIQRGIELVLGRQLREARLELGYTAPPHAKDYGKHLHSPFVFGAGSTAWHIPLELLKHPNPFRDAAVFQQACRQCEYLQNSLNAVPPNGWSARIAQMLKKHRGQLLPLAELAAQVHVSPRTLIRHLRAEGTSYQTLLDTELSQQALELFEASARNSVEDVGLALGYQDATAFRRAFKRWFGDSPRAYLARRAGRLAHDAPHRPERV